MSGKTFFTTDEITKMMKILTSGAVYELIKMLYF
jgi:hypothetical protein